MEPTTSQTQDSGIGAIAGSVIVVLVIIAGAFYLLDTIRTQKQSQQPVTETSTTQDATSTADLEAELESINVEDIDTELADIEASF